jgi:hypothetical protein
MMLYDDVQRHNLFLFHICLYRNIMYVILQYSFHLD